LRNSLSDLILTGIIAAAAYYEAQADSADAIGELLSLEYLAQKAGDVEPTIYEHRFEAPLPALEQVDGELVAVGGEYSVKDGWIHG
jgi:hypothetical protein